MDEPSAAQLLIRPEYGTGLSFVSITMPARNLPTCAAVSGVVRINFWAVNVPEITFDPDCVKNGGDGSFWNKAASVSRAIYDAGPHGLMKPPLIGQIVPAP